MRKTILSCAAVALLAAAPTASAADRTATLSATAPSFAWDGGPGTSIGYNTGVIGGASVGNFIGCFDDVADCEETLLKVEVAGKLTLIADAADDANDVLDMYLYATDESGEFSEGLPIVGIGSDDELGEGSGAGTSGDEKIEIQVEPGYYVVQIKFFLADNDTYKGSATLSGFPEPAAAPVVDAPAAPPAPQSEQPAAQPAPQQAEQPKPAAKKKPSKKAACKKKAKKIKSSKKRKKALRKCAKMR